MGGIGRLVSGGLSNRHSVGRELPPSTHTHCSYTVIALSPSVSLSLSFGDLMERAFSMEDNSSGNGL